jgi:hypothetical protein
MAVPAERGARPRWLGARVNLALGLPMRTQALVEHET